MMRSIADIFRSYAEFDSQGRHVNGTDKQSNHNYGDAYEAIFSAPERASFDINRWHPRDGHPSITQMREQVSIRSDVKLMMEVGVADGACLRAWSEVFPNALIVGMDIHPSAQACGDRIEFHIGDQRSREDCHRAAAGRLFDVIIEDATHELGNTLLTLYHLWPFVRPSGLYIVEEWDGGAGSDDNIRSLFRGAEVVPTPGPFGGNEPLVVFRKPG